MNSFRCNNSRQVRVLCAVWWITLAEFPFSSLGPVAFDGPLPGKVDVAVIGGGVIGVCTALFLAEKGQSVLLVEKGRIAAEQSSRNWGWIRQQGRDPDELPIMVEARRHWKKLAARCDRDIGLTEAGVAYIARDAAEMDRFAAWLPHAQAHGVDSRMVSAGELATLVPGMQVGCSGALYTAGDMRAEPWLAVPALAQVAARDGVMIRENCAARGIERSAGRVSAVVTEKGRVETGAVVLAGGAWSALFLRALGVGLPQLCVRSSVVAVDAAPMAYGGGGAFGGLAWRTRADGGYTLAPGGFHELFIGPDAFRNATKFWTQLKNDPLGTRFLPAAPSGYPDAWGTRRRWALDALSPFERMRILDPTPSRRRLNRAAQSFAELFPQLGPVTPKAQWAGMIDTMPDIVPVVDQVAAIPGLTIATGMSGHGFGIGPGIGRVVADLVTGGPVGHDLTRFRLNRFSDGSKMDLGPAL